jgi:hypothetical protein
MRRWWYRWWPLGLAALSACATANTYPPPAAGQFASVEGSVAQARATGADTDAAAVEHLRLAELQLAQAKQHLAAGDNQGAALLLARADADAELSRMLRRNAQATAEARTTETELRETRAQTAPAVQPVPAQPLQP